MRELLIMLLAASLSECSSTTEKFTAEGSMVYAISCQLQSVDSCIEKAGELCGSLGYHFVLPDGTPTSPPVAPAAAVSTSARSSDFYSGNNESIGPSVAPATAPGASSSTKSAGSMFNRQYYIRCRPEDAS
jgi:hypothetical protein